MYETTAPRHLPEEDQFAEIRRLVANEAQPLDALNAMVPSLASNAPQGLVGWVYRDMHRRQTPEWWKNFIDVVGPDNVRVLAYSTGRSSETEAEWVRGQFLLSPEALERLKVYLKEKGTQ